MQRLTIIKINKIQVELQTKSWVELKCVTRQTCTDNVSWTTFLPSSQIGHTYYRQTYNKSLTLFHCIYIPVLYICIFYLRKTSYAEETIEKNNSFERVAYQNWVKVQAYHADSGVFTSHKWVDKCQNNHQELTFWGVNNHHKIGWLKEGSVFYNIFNRQWWFMVASGFQMLYWQAYAHMRL